MPRGDGTGPMGTGPMTGRGAGYCAGYPVPGFMNPGAGYGLGGRGRGFRRFFPRTAVPFSYGYAVDEPAKNEREVLSNQAEHLENQLRQVKNRLKALDEEAD